MRRTSEWRKSSFSDPIDCVEVAWRKSSYSNPNDCVEVSWVAEDAAVRDSKNPEGPILIFDQASFTAALRHL